MSFLVRSDNRLLAFPSGTLVTTDDWEKTARVSFGRSRGDRTAFFVLPENLMEELYN
uniref:hypothetical protein n=1 Tax=Nonlabens sp. Ci31 TaxID=2608253 RepID=UPI00147677BD|nr:hypothetical protein [Nonlabens sp. Ci31]